MFADLLKEMRPKQWTKNVFVFAAPLFSKIVIEKPWTIIPTLAAFFLLSFLSSSVYLINDVLDRENDRKHPKKRHRPIAAGRISPGAAVVCSICLTAASLTGGLILWRMGIASIHLVLILGAYYLLNLAYSTVLKHIVIVDVLAIALGFVLRAVAGGCVVGALETSEGPVEISAWLLLCTFLIALFLGFSKRRHELVLLNDGAHTHRQILKEYSPYYLDQMIGVVTASTVMAYSLYAMNPEVHEKLGTDDRLLGTVLFVFYGIFRYLYLVHQKDEGGDPSELVLADRSLFLNILLWGISMVLILAL